MAIEPQLDDHGAVEPAHEEVGEHVRPRLRVEHRLELEHAGEDVVAVLPAESPQAFSGAQLIEGAIGSAVGVRHGQPIAVRPPQLVDFRRHLGGDPLRVVVQQRRQREDVDGPAAPLGDLGDVTGERSAGDDADGPPVVSRGRRAHRRTGR